ncbi:MAG: hypothetical protein HY706_17520 [Candidatus Hydrogenedentes bacterium]|nr:hypothetical protein [Candidatus Hydrogenedentota bacterium]
MNKHISYVSRAIRNEVETGSPQGADAKSDFLNALARAWSDFVFAKKNEELPGS